MKVLAVLHIADLFRDQRQWLPTKRDWAKARAILAGTWPTPLPGRVLVMGEDDVEQLEQWFHYASTLPFIAIDTEYDRHTKQLVMFGMGGPGGDILQCTGFMGERLRHRMTVYLQWLAANKPIVFQNQQADLPILREAFGVGYRDYAQAEDTMLAHSALWSELPHDLEFLDSIYGKHRKLKHLARDDLWLYNAGDVASTVNAWLGIRKELERDPASETIYRRFLLPLTPILLEAHERGIRVDMQRARDELKRLEEAMDTATHIAAAYCGYPINLGSSDQLVRHLKDIDGLKLKSIDRDTVAGHRAKFLPFDAQDDVTVELVLERIEQGAHPLLEARVLYSEALQIASHYLEPMLAGNGRVHARFHPWTQANGRWSTVDPPLAQLPESTRDILIPDEGWPWFGWDWSAIELRLMAAQAGDDVLLRAFERGEDVHLQNTREIFGDNTITKDDPRRTFAKRFVFRLLYGGDPRHAASIPGAKQLGLNGQMLVKASQRWLRAHPAIARFWKILEASAVQRREVRTFLGRRRTLLTRDLKQAARQAYDYPMQAAVADIKNWVIIQADKRLGDSVRFVYEIHDAVWFAIRESEWDTAVPVLKSLAERTWDINSTKISFPAEWKERHP